MRSGVAKRQQLIVLHQRGKWLVRFRGKSSQFADRDSAVRAAIGEAFICSRDGAPAQVLSQDGDGEVVIVWTYGVDPDPPDGAVQLREDAAG